MENEIKKKDAEEFFVLPGIVGTSKDEENCDPQNSYQNVKNDSGEDFSQPFEVRFI